MLKTDEMASVAPGSAAIPPAPASKGLSCPNCGGAIELKAAGYTVTLVCPYCGSLLDVADPDVKIIERWNEMNAELAIPLGTRGTLKGVEWEAIGHLRKSEGGEYPWEEYLLFNPYHGYRWLVTDGRGWTFGTMLTETPTMRGSQLVVDGEGYSPFFASGRARVDQVVGEFYWRVKRGEEVATADYVRPGFMLSTEADERERSWTLGELLEAKEIGDAFGVDRPKRWRSGGRPPMPHQPSPYGKSIRTFAAFGALAAAALMLLMIVFGGTGPEQRFETVLTPGQAARSFTLGPVELTRPRQGVTISARAPTLDNAWVDLDYALVDRRTQTAWQAYAVAERYSGYDSDGAWSEGSRGATAKLASVPAGSYDLVVDATASNWGLSGSMREVPVTIAVAPGASFFANLILALIAVAIPALWTIARHIGFETARMGESDQGSALKEMMESDDE